MGDQSGWYGRGFHHVSDDEIYKFARRMNAKVALFVHVDEDYLLTQREWSSNSSAAKSKSNEPKKRIFYENLACNILQFKILAVTRALHAESGSSSLDHQLYYVIEY